MTDLNKLRSEFESNEYIKSIIQNFEWSEEFNNYQIKDCVINGNIFDLLEAKNDEQFLNGAWFGWQEKAKAQAVPEGFKIVPIELSEEIAERLALERVQKPRPENDPVWVEIAERAYKSNLLAKKWELVREYKILTEASESGAEG
ncbi:hypothetical protein ABTC66_05140 [Acinetobacter baumannii]|nr:hypothetical protein [Acinetobacter baumannii]MDC5681153.1 hypothetical protein [Acinetobacter baumannii]